MEKLEKLYEGKAKQLYATDDPEVLWVEYKNTATAGDGEKKEDFTGKGRLNNLITTIIFDPQNLGIIGCVQLLGLALVELFQLLHDSPFRSEISRMLFSAFRRAIPFSASPEKL